jgi:adenosylcobinamide amidohydrolase
MQDRIHCFDRWMVVRFPEPYRCTSWAVVNGGISMADRVAWLFLDPDEIQHCQDVPAWFRSRMDAAGLGGAVGLLTSRRLHQYIESGSEASGCHVVATVGLSNALAVGDPTVTAPAQAAGTINILCTLSTPLTIEGSLEALAIASEARTAAMLEAQVPSIVSGHPATGTGTDCIVIAHPAHGPATEYCGKHTEIGHRIGAHVRDAVAKGVHDWLREMGR